MLKPTFKIATLVVLAILTASCRLRPGKPKTAAGTDVLTPEEIAAGGVYTPEERSDIGIGQPIRDVQFEPVRFRFDSAKVDSPELTKIQTVADYLKRNPSYTLVIEGHCDERGTAAYNMALGERRAQAVRAELIRLGIDAARIQTVSYGEERPASLGHSEEHWRLNRRAEFVVYP